MTLPDSIIEEVAVKYAITFAGMFVNHRRGKFGAARRECWHRMQVELGWSLIQIGDRFGVDHTTVLYGIRKHRGLSPRTRITEPARIMLTFRGCTGYASQLAREYGIRRNTLIGRLNAGWPVERALTEKVNNRGN